MSCGGGKPNFRLLDAYVGWDAEGTTSSNLCGFHDPAGVRLKQEDEQAVDAGAVIGRIFPPRLAKGCGACEWYLVTACEGKSEVLHRDACHSQWEPLWKHGDPAPIVEGIAIALWRGFLAVADRGAGNVQIWTREGGRRVAVLEKAAPGPIAFSRKGELLLTSATDKRIARYGLDGKLRGYLNAEAPWEINRIAVDGRNAIWVVTAGPEGDWELWRADWGAAVFSAAGAEELEAAFPATGIVAESSAGFCFEQPSISGFEASTCFSWCGRPLHPEDFDPPKPARRKTRGQLLTRALDSGIPRCRWHRVQVDADLPAGSSLEIAVATTEDLALPPQGDSSREPEWGSFPAGPPHPKDWTTLPPSALDALIDQPPGRYLYFRMRLRGAGAETPVVRRVRIDFPRSTSLEHLPDVYRENPQAEDFSERFLSLFDASIGELDRVITRYPALLDPTGVPEQLLAWLAGFFDIQLDPTWDEAKRRLILQHAPQLYRLRGTPAGVRMAVELVFGVTPAVEESSAAGAWGAVGNREEICQAKITGQAPPSVRRTARVGRVHLFGSSRVRFRAGRSALGGAPLRSYGNPDQDPFAERAYRFRVLVPPLPGNAPGPRERLMSLINAQKPAHTVASVRVGGTGFLLGFTSAVGIDSVFASPAPPKLGSSGNVRLNRSAILWHGTRVGGRTRVGQNTVAGIQTIVG